MWYVGETIVSKINNLKTFKIFPFNEIFLLAKWL